MSEVDLVEQNVAVNGLDNALLSLGPLSSHLVQIGFSKSLMDPCLSGELEALSVVDVDDMVLDTPPSQLASLRKRTESTDRLGKFEANGTTLAGRRIVCKPDRILASMEKCVSKNVIQCTFEGSSS